MSKSVARTKRSTKAGPADEAGGRAKRLDAVAARLAKHHGTVMKPEHKRWLAIVLEFVDDVVPSWAASLPSGNEGWFNVELLTRELDSTRDPVTDPRPEWVAKHAEKDVAAVLSDPPGRLRWLVEAGELDEKPSAGWSNWRRKR
jgi:hypothetical protein